MAMTQRERFIKTLKREKIGGQVPHFEIAVFLSMELFGKVFPNHRQYAQWHQMSKTEQNLHIKDIADIHIATAQKFHHSAIFLHPNPSDFENTLRLAETIREKTGDAYCLVMHGDPTWSIPDGETMMEFSAKMYDEAELLNAESQRRMERMLDFAQKLDCHGHLVDGFMLCSDYCFNTNPFFNEDKFEELIVPYLSGVIKGYHDLGYYVIKHTDGNIMPILEQLVACKPDAIHSLDPQGGVDLAEVKRKYGDRVTLIGNVNCGLLQTGTDEECKADILRSLSEGMTDGTGYIFSTSNCVYTGMPLERYQMMHDLWLEYGNYDKQNSKIVKQVSR